MPDHKKVLGLGPFEQAVMEALWQAPPGEWLSLAAVRVGIPGGQPGSQLQSTLAMLCIKSHAQRHRPAGSPGWTYRATMPKEEYLLDRVTAVLEHSSDPGQLLRRALAQPRSPSRVPAIRGSSSAHPDLPVPGHAGTTRAQPGEPAGAAGRRPPPEWGAAG